MADIGKTCIELIGGDKKNLNDSDIEDADLIVSTPEKWDYITRSLEIIPSISLVLVNKNNIQFISLNNLILD